MPPLTLTPETPLERAYMDEFFPQDRPFDCSHLRAGGVSFNGEWLYVSIGVRENPILEKRTSKPPIPFPTWDSLTKDVQAELNIDMEIAGQAFWNPQTGERIDPTTVEAIRRKP